MNKSSLRGAGLFWIASLFLLPVLCSAAVRTYGNLPLNFEPNRGQADPQVRFLARGQGLMVLLTDHEAILSPNGSTAVRMRLLGSGQPAQTAAIDRLPGLANYLYGNDPRQWHTNIPMFAKVRYRRVYPGVDLIYYGNQGRLEYDFVVAPGADPGLIRLGFTGTRRLETDDHGDLVIHTSTGTLRFHRPLIYQEANGKRLPIEGHYALSSENRVGFSIARYDRSRPLVIDPTLVYSGMLTSSTGRAIAVDSAGNAYVTGNASAPAFPIVGGLAGTRPFNAAGNEVFVAKLNPAGDTILYSTCFGGSGADQGNGVAVDSSGNVYVTGVTGSSDFPAVNAARGTYGGSNDAFVAKLNPQGTALLFSTYLGGSAFDAGNGIALDKAGANVYVTGVAQSTNFPVQAAYQSANKGGRDGFVTKLSSSGALVYSTYLGGKYDESAIAIAVDSTGAAYITGNTSSTDYPHPTGDNKPNPATSPSGFVTKLSADGASLVYSGYLGGTCQDWPYGIAVDLGGSAYVAGATCSWDFPITDSAAQRSKGPAIAGFVSRISADAKSLVYSTFITGTKQVWAYAIAVDSAGNAYVTGYTTAGDFPTANALQESREWLVPVLVYSKDGGVSWDSLDHNLSGSAVMSVEIDPRNPKALVIAESGINRSTDGGSTWNHTDMWDNVNATARSRTNLDVLYAATSSGSIYKSSDNGATWTRMGSTPGTVNAVAVHPSDPTQLAIGTNGGGVYGSADSGATWSALNNGLANLTIYDLAVSPDNKVVYAGTGNGIYQSPDDLSTWSPLNNGIPPFTAAYLVTPDPVHTSVLYAWVGSSVYKSTDSGATWATITSTIKESISGFALAPSDPSTLYAATAHAVYRSKDGGASWSAVLPDAQVFGLATVVVDPKNPDLLYAGMALSNDAFVTKVKADGSAFLYSTYLGGPAGDAGNGIAVDSSGNAYVTGNGSAMFPTTPAAVSQSLTGAFVAKIADSTASCSFVIRPGDASSAARFFSSVGGEGRYVVVAPSGCPWQVTPNAPWLTLPGGQNSGVGVGPIWIEVAPNTGAARQGTVTIGGQSLTIRQAAATCTYSLSTYGSPMPAAGGTVIVSVTTGAACDWVAYPTIPWITTDLAMVTGNAAVALTVDANLSAPPRTGRVNIGNRSVVISQAGGATFTFNPSSASFGPQAATGSVAVTASSPSIGWVVTSTQPWLVLTSLPSAPGNGTVTYSVQANTTGAARTAFLVVGSDVFPVVQTAQGAPAANPVNITSISVASGGADIAPNAWIAIKGTGLAPAGLSWADSLWSNAPEFSSGQMPTQLHNVSVKVNGKPAYVYYISPTQVNVLTPLDAVTGKVDVQLTNGADTSAPFTVNRNATAPAFLLLGAGQYIAAVHLDSSLVVPATLSAYPGTPAKPNETIILFATGFGLPSTSLSEGSATQSSALPSLPVIQIGGLAATVSYAGVIAPGLYQFNVVVPSSASSGDNAVTAAYAGAYTPAGAVISVQR